MTTELYYIGAGGITAGTAKYHQNDDVIKPMTDISFVGPTEIGDGTGEIHQPFQDTAVEFRFIY